IYYGGQGVQQDYAEARKWWEKAAAQGNAKAQYNLGVMYHEGQGVRQDKQTAKEWFSKACNNGDQQGCDNYRKLNEAGV
ncbi:MAG: sel1 repeat family protein, partial [Deltaproteobacteria bacterium]|nr:sel1 repeat family protein [Deltaproteobacteria bacterium]